LLKLKKIDGELIMNEPDLKIIAENAVVAMKSRNLEPVNKEVLEKLIAKFDTLTAEEKAATKLIVQQNKQYEAITKDIESTLAALGELPLIDVTLEELKAIIEKTEKKRRRKAAELLEPQNLETPILE
jgi:hypothetical protein